MYEYLTEPAKYHLYIAENIKVLNIYPLRTPQFMVPASGMTVPNETEKNSVCEIRMKPFYCFI